MFPRFSLVLVALLVVGSSLVARAQSTYVGAERCKSCHEFEYQVWAQGPHAKANLALNAEQLSDPKCNNCHSTVPGELDPKLAGVQCERCHGGGKYYHPSYVMKDRELARAVGLLDPTAQHCLACHTEAAPSITPFDFTAMWAKIDHGKKAREAWEKAKKSASAAATPAPASATPKAASKSAAPPASAKPAAADAAKKPTH